MINLKASKIQILRYGDSAKILPQEIPDSSIDIIFTDPPYGLGYGIYDDAEVFYGLEEELYRILKPNSWLIFYWSTKKLYEPFIRLKKFRYIWQIICSFPTTYSKSIIGDRKYMPILVFAKGDPKIIYRRFDIIPALELPCVIEKIGNALFKPTSTTSQLLQIFTKEKDLILDPFMGYGSIPFCCHLWKRNYIGIEIDETCFKFAEKFIKTGTITYIGKRDIIYNNKQTELFKDDK